MSLRDIEWGYWGFGTLLVSGFVGVCILIGVVIFAYANAPDEGRVVDSSETPQMITTSCSGNPVICTTQVYPPRWDLYIVNGDEEGPISVSEHVYNQCTISEWYPDCAQD